MGNDLAWKIAATPADRWALARFFVTYNNVLTFKTRSKQRQFQRATVALGLQPPLKTLLAGKEGHVAQAEDQTTRSLFTVTGDVAEFVTECLERLEVPAAPGSNAQSTGVPPAILFTLAPILEQLEDKAHAKAEVDLHESDATEWDENKEDWSLSMRPVLDRPDKFVDVLVESLLEVLPQTVDPASPTPFDRWVRRMIEHCAPARPGKNAG